TFTGIGYARRPNQAIDGRGLAPHETCSLVGRSRDLHPHGELSYTAFGCAVCPRTSVLFRPTGRTSMKAVLIVQPHAAKTCSMASWVPNTTRCVTPTMRRRRYDFTTWA